MAKNVAILVGLPGSGKTLAGEFFIKNHLPVVRMGDLTLTYLKKKKLIFSEKNENKARRELREKFGNDIYAVSCLDKVKKMMNKHNLVIIEGMRSPSEWQYFQKNLPKAKIIYLEADKKIRFDRLSKRQPRPLTKSEIELREKYEVNKLQISKLKKSADFMVKNNNDVAKFYSDLKNLSSNL
ncbi:hypothetical protein A2W14_00595 [Candidatus Gottesmanbacteria bacterium RBG_16_37_8]|uniref:Dephospho-CoA kinase n=1 Tax=Candidatus Gottesmanbacteria bacterium RBG_16_37_8 TaxID=1798371 RepID=A0A1F5YVD9_9BACT|nr:MAG: hypothetical protein A2W14_00595 [Candidatus Gottesmanbacteria bacterium RBG_16_37_8]